MRLSAASIRVALVAIVGTFFLATAVQTHAATTSRSVLQYGDSLALGTGVFLAARLPGWRVQESSSVSRHANEGPTALKTYGASLPRVLVVSLGTNDDPGAVRRFARTVAQVVRVAGPERCVIWSSIVRPPYQGITYAGYNTALRRLARSHPTLHVFDWQALAHAHPAWFGTDGVHPSAEGYRARAAAIARLVRRCA